jgi:hypothetical protein
MVALCIWSRGKFGCLAGFRRDVYVHLACSTRNALIEIWLAYRPSRIELLILDVVIITLQVLKTCCNSDILTTL